MKVKNIFVAALALVPAFASAHPGHDTTALHLHLGSPGALNAVDLRLTFAALILCLAVQALRSTKRR